MDAVELPLADFLSFIKTRGVRTTIRDHQRVAKVLAAPGPWTKAKLKYVLGSLLTTSRDELARFDHLFESFFDQPELTRQDLDLERALDDLSKLPPEPQLFPEPPPPGSPPPGLPPPESLPAYRRWLLRVAPPLLVAAAIALPTFFYQWTADQIPDVHEDEIWREATERLPTTTTQAQRLYPDAPHFVEIPTEPGPSPAGSSPWQAAFWTLLFAGSAYGTGLWWTHRVAEAKPAHYNPERRDSFHPGRIGISKETLGWLGEETLDLLAESLGYFKTAEESEELDIDETVRQTADSAGLIELAFVRHRRLRTVLVLQDRQAEPLRWNPVATELIAGLEQRGIQVLSGSFAGSPGRFRTVDGNTVRLIDLDHDRDSYLALVFTDGQGLGTRHAADLEVLAHWPRVAWLELRDARFWDVSALYPARYGIPVYPATRDGLVRVFGHFLTETGGTKSAEGEPRRRRRRRPNLRSQVEDTLGDALRWAQACAMIQPLTPALAERLRRAFHDYLPPQRFERLVRLPGTDFTVSGLSFTTPVLALLRTGFQVYYDDPEQRKVLEFLLAVLEEHKPEHPDSLAYLTWEMRSERVRLELDPDAALERLGELAALAPGLRRELETVAPADAIPRRNTELVPLRRSPEDRRAYQQLGRMAPRSGIPVKRYLPLRRLEKGLAGLVFAGLLVCGLLGFRPPPEIAPASVEVTNTLSRPVWIASPSGPQRLDSGRSSSWDIQDETLQTTVFTRGSIDVLNRTGQRADLKFEIRGSDERRSCVENLPGLPMPVTVYRCSPTTPAGPSLDQPSWYEKYETENGSPPPVAVMSIGIVVGDGGDEEVGYLDPVLDSLLSTSLVDLVYEIEVGAELPDNLMEASGLGEILADFANVTQITWRVSSINREEEIVSLMADSISADYASASQSLGTESKPPPIESQSSDRLRLAMSHTARAREVLLKGGILTEEVTEEYRKAISIYRELGEKQLEAESLAELGKAFLEAGRDSETIPTLQQARTLYVELGDIGSAEMIQRSLVGLAGASYVAGEQFVETISNIELAWRYIPPGTFQMGSPEDEAEQVGNEKLHEVRLTRGFWMGETEVTQEQWRRIAGNNPAGFAKCGTDCPVETVNWYEVLWYANELSDRMSLDRCYEMAGCNGKEPGEDFECTEVTFQGLDCSGYRLPTEAEWEYAARAKTTTPFWTGPNITTEQANYDGNYHYADYDKGEFRETTVTVRSFEPNPWGLYEVHGNVWEWVWDGYGEYSEGEVEDPVGVSSDAGRVFRGGSWIGLARECRAAYRGRNAPENRINIVGFRLARTYP